jgi:hypothetical protein
MSDELTVEMEMKDAGPDLFDIWVRLSLAVLTGAASAETSEEAVARMHQCIDEAAGAPATVSARDKAIVAGHYMVEAYQLMREMQQT